MKITIPGKPIPKQRARYSKRGSFVVTYDPQEKDKNLVKQIMTQQLVDHFNVNVNDNRTGQQLYKICMSKSFSVKFIFFLPLNQSDSVSAKNKKLWGITRANTKPDYDNLEKFYLDCANGILWDDDSSVVKAEALKLYSEVPRVEIEVNALENIIVNEKVEKVINMFSPSELFEFQKHAEKISKILAPNLDQNDDVYQKLWIEWTALTLSEFAIAHASKLNKIAKIGEITSEIKEFEDFIASIENQE